MKPLSSLNKIKLWLAKLKHQNERTPYRFGVNDDKCCIAFFETVFCGFENVTKSPGKVRVGHFSVEDPFRGARIGEQCLRKFAAHIAELEPNINTIEFSLYRLPTNFDHQKVAKERLRLLERIGAKNTSITDLPQGMFQVDGSWEKSQW